MDTKIPKPIKQKASQGGRVMRQKREEKSVKSMQSAKSAAMSSKKNGMKY